MEIRVDHGSPWQHLQMCRCRPHPHTHQFEGESSPLEKQQPWSVRHLQTQILRFIFS